MPIVLRFRGVKCATDSWRAYGNSQDFLSRRHFSIFLRASSKLRKTSSFMPIEIAGVTLVKEDLLGFAYNMAAVPILAGVLYLFFGILLRLYAFVMQSSHAKIFHKGDNQMTFVIRPYKDLPALDQGWLTLKDHFIATVGPNSGQGKSLKNILVIADAKIAAKSSFSKHPHKDMEILTWVVEGTLHHQDDNENDQQVPTAHLQLMSARDGIFHAEGNSTEKPLRLLQIWIKPNMTGGKPVVVQTGLSKKGFNLMAGPVDAPFIIRQDLWLYAALIDGQEFFEIPEGKFAYAILIGSLKLNETQLQDGDAVEIGPGEYSVQGQGQTILIQQNI